MQCKFAKQGALAFRDWREEVVSRERSSNDISNQSHFVTFL